MNADEADGIRRVAVTPYVDAPELPPPSASVQVVFGAHSRRGRFHAVNEDHYVVIELGRHQETLLTSLPDDVIAKRFDEFGYGMVVADGLGRGGAGEAASRLAISTLMHLILHFGKWNLRIDSRIADEVMQRAERFYRHVDSAVSHDATKDGRARMETTLTAVFGAGRRLFSPTLVTHAYLFGTRRLRLDARSHHRAAAIGNVPSCAAGGRQRRRERPPHILTDTVGMAGAVGPTIDIERFQLADGDRVLVCTNGLTDMVDEARIGEVLASSQSPADQAYSLVELAMAAGGDDDATALVASYRVPA